MDLKNKTALIFAANGAIAGGVARIFAEAGANVFLSGRNLPETQRLAEEINESGGNAFASRIDATDEKAVPEYVSSIYGRTGRIDIALNGIGIRAAEGEFGKPLTTLSPETFMLPVVKNLRSQFLTAKAVAPFMMEAKSGVILTISAPLSVQPSAGLAGVSAYYGAIEAFTRNLASELGASQVRVNCIRSGAILETRTMRETLSLISETSGAPAEMMREMMAQRALLKKTPAVEEVARVALLLASENAAALTGQIINASSGTILH